MTRWLRRYWSFLRPVQRRTRYYLVFTDGQDLGPFRSLNDAWDSALDAEACQLQVKGIEGRN